MSTERINLIDPSISIAPMMAYTERHFCHLMRLFHPKLLLYTEMVTVGQVLHDKRPGGITARQSTSSPIGVQLAGCDPGQVAAAGKLLLPHGYDEININIGCPSSRVAAARYGACLFKDPKTVAQCVRALSNEVPIPVTIKTRIGVDDYDQYEHLADFVGQVSEAGCRRFIIHARKAWLSGLNPKQNRNVPELQPEMVYQLKRDFPQLDIIINGGIDTVATVKQHMQHVNGVMLGRVAYQNTRVLPELIACIYPEDDMQSISSIIHDYLDYVALQYQPNQSLQTLLKPLFGMFHGVHGARQMRQRIDAMFRVASKSDLMRQVLEFKNALLQFSEVEVLTD